VSPSGASQFKLCLAMKLGWPVMLYLSACGFMFGFGKRNHFVCLLRALAPSRHEQSDSGRDVVNSTLLTSSSDNSSSVQRTFQMTLCDRGNLFSGSLPMVQHPLGSLVGQSAPFPPPHQSFFDVGLLFTYNEDKTMRAVVPQRG